MRFTRSAGSLAPETARREGSGRGSPGRSRRGLPKLRYELVALASLPDAEFAERFEAMGDVIADATKECGGEQWAADDWASRRKATRSTDAYMVWDGDVLAGFLLFSTFPFRGRMCLHMKTGYVRSAYQGGGIGFSLTVRVAYRTFLARPWGEFLLVSDMLNPVVVAGWVSRFPGRTKMVPATFGVRSTELEEIGAQLAMDLYPWADYDPEGSILRGKTLPRAPVIELSGNQPIDDYFREELEPTNGDTLLYIAEFDHPTVLVGLVELLRQSGRGLNRRLRRPRHARHLAQSGTRAST